MYSMLRNKHKFEWTIECEQKFCDLKLELSKNNCLYQVDPDAMIYIETDACDTGFGAILYQMVRGEKRIIEYYSKLFNKPQSAYATVEKEAIAIIFTIKKYKFLLLGRHFTIKTDHKPLLQYFENTKNANSRKLWMIFELQEFDYKIEYIEGSRNTHAD